MSNNNSGAETSSNNFQYENTDNYQSSFPSNNLSDNFESQNEIEMAYPEISQLQNKRKVYLDNSYIKMAEHQFKGVKFTEKRLEKLYRQSYEKYFYHYVWWHQKVYYHPEITRADYDLLSRQYSLVPYKMLFSELLCFSGILWSYYRSDYGRKWVNKNFSFALLVYGSMPFITLGASWLLSNFYIDSKCNKFELGKKYNIFELSRSL